LLAKQLSNCVPLLVMQLLSAEKSSAFTDSLVHLPPLSVHLWMLAHSSKGAADAAGCGIVLVAVRECREHGCNR
jgi:hypothetical protein